MNLAFIKCHETYSNYFEVDKNHDFCFFAKVTIDSLLLLALKESSFLILETVVRIMSRINQLNVVTKSAEVT